MAAIAAPADLEIRAAAPTATFPKLLHPTSRVEEVSTGNPSPLIISTEGKRLHPRGDSAPAESPVSSTSNRENHAAMGSEPVSGHTRIPRTPACRHRSPRAPDPPGSPGTMFPPEKG